VGIRYHGKKYNEEGGISNELLRTRVLSFQNKHFIFQNAPAIVKEKKIR